MLYRTIFNIIERTKRRIHRQHMLLRHNLTLGDSVMLSCKAVVRTSYAHQENTGEISIQSHSEIHDFAHLYSGTGFIKIGKYCSVNPFCVLDGHGGGITIGDYVRIANHVTIVSSNHVFKDTALPICKQGLSKQGVTIEDDVWIGSGARILDGVTIGKGSIIGAGAVVTKNIPANTVAAGVPAKIMKSR